MKYIFFTILISLFCSCGTEENNIENEKTNTTISNFKTSDLTDYELPFSIKTEKLRDKNGLPIDFVVTHEADELEWKINLGEKHSILLEDWGNEKKEPSKEIKHQESLEQFFEFNFIENKKNEGIEGNLDYVLYSKKIPEDTVNIQHHFYATKEFGEAYYYVIKSNSMETYSLEEATKMLNTALSLKTIEKAPRL